jgi:lipopolysaccharide transport system permease protein
MGYLRAVINYRHFIYASIKGEMKGRFARSRIGALWFILHPLAMALIYALVLSEVLGAKIGGVDNKAAYSIYLMAGIAGWGLFSEIVNRGITIFIEQESALKKIMFPRICLPIIVLGHAIINQFILILAIFVIFCFYGHFPTIHWLALPLGIIIISAFGMGLGLILGILNVFSRDIAQFMAVILNLWFWLTPIVYTPDIVPDSIAPALYYNPIAPLVRIYQDIILYNTWPDTNSLLFPITLSAIFLIIGLIIFKKASAEIVDEL